MVKHFYYPITMKSMYSLIVVMKRNYKKDVYDSNINQEVTASINIEDAVFKFVNKFREILDNHAPIKVFQMRRNYTPYLSEKTKEMIKWRNSWKEVAVKKGFKSAEKFAKELGKDIKKAAVEDKRMYFK